MIGGYVKGRSGLWQMLWILLEVLEPKFSRRADRCQTPSQIVAQGRITQL